VATLVDGIEYMGSYSVTFNDGNLANGVYIYRIYVNGFIQVKKAVLLK